MLRKNAKTLIITNILILLPVVWGIYAYPTLPAQIPVQFDFSGTIHAYANKWVVFLPTPIILAVLWSAVGEAAIRDKKVAVPTTYVSTLAWSITFLAFIIFALLALCSRGEIEKAQRIVPALIGASIVFLGFRAPKIPQNSWLGIRTKATKEDPIIWKKTQKLFGKCCLLCGPIIITLCFTPIMLAYTGMILALLFTGLIPYVYSCVL